MGLEAGQHLGHYEIVTTLGAGGMVRVYQATHRHLSSAHVIVVLDQTSHPEHRDRFLSEARLQARLEHPHIKPVTEVIDTPNVAAFVTPFLPGEDLGTRLARQGRATVTDAVSWTLQGLDALSFVHQEGIAHHDLKPANLFLESRPRSIVRVKGFGAAGTAGPPHYRSPEQLQTPAAVDHRADLFSMGTILYELVTGTHPFHGDTDTQTRTNIIRGHYSRAHEVLPHAHRMLAAVIDRALSTRPQDRFETAQSFAQALQQASPTAHPARLPRS